MQLFVDRVVWVGILLREVVELGAESTRISFGRPAKNASGARDAPPINDTHFLVEPSGLVAQLLDRRQLGSGRSVSVGALKKQRSKTSSQLLAIRRIASRTPTSTTATRSKPHSSERKSCWESPQFIGHDLATTGTIATCDSPLTQARQ